MARWEKESEWNQKAKQSQDRRGPAVAVCGIPGACNCVGVFPFEFMMEQKGLRYGTLS